MGIIKAAQGKHCAASFFQKSEFLYKKGLPFLCIYANISLVGKQVSLLQKHLTQYCLRNRKGETMKNGKNTQYFVVREKAIPQVLLKVVEAKSLIETEKVASVQEAVDAVGISRSSFYKYKDDIFQFHDNAQGTTLTLTFQMDDQPGVLSDVLKIIAEYRANILTIHQSIPINGIASLSLSVQVLQTTGDVSEMIEQMENKKGVHHVKILAKD